LAKRLIEDEVVLGEVSSVFLSIAAGQGGFCTIYKEFCNPHD